MNVLQGIFNSIKWLTIFDMILIALYALVLLRHALPVKKAYRWIDYVPSLAVVIALASLLSGDTSLPGILLDSLAALLFLFTLKRIFRRPPTDHAPAFRVWKLILCVCGLIPIGFALLIAGETRYNPVSQLSDLSYSMAFVKMNERLSREYPFGEWKNVNWNELRQKYEPRFQQAEQEQNKDLYYMTLREYLFSFRDGHIKIANEQLYDDNPVFKHDVGGSFGISTIQLDNSEVRVNLLLADSPAEKSGMKPGAKIITWDGKAAKDAYGEVFWSENPLATDGNRTYNQGRFWVRAPIGKEIQVEFQNMGETERKNITLTAYDDQYETLKKTRVKWKKEDPPIESKVVNNEYGYIKLNYFLPSLSMPDPAEAFTEALNGLAGKKLKGLILDVRDNPGGDDDLVANIAGHFVNKEKFYESVSYYCRNTGTFEFNTNETRIIKPVQPLYTGKVAIIINNRTVSSGEALPLVLKGLPNITVVGFTSTNGSFGVVSSPIRMELPEGYIVQFPDGRSLAQDNTIQGDSNDTGHGGIAPDYIVPLSEQNFIEKYVNGQDVELNYAIAALNK